MVNNPMNKGSKNRHYLPISILFHFIVLTALIFSFDFNGKMPVLKNSEKDMQVLNAVVLNAPPGTELPAQSKPLPEPKKILETPLPPKPKSVEQKKIVEAKPKPKAIALSDQHKKQKALIEKQLLADLKKQTEQKKKIKNKEIERALQKEMKAEAAKLLQQQLLQEKDKLAQVQSQQARGEVNKYKALILQAISRQWLVPPTVNKKLSCELLIRLAPNGLVLDVQIAKSSGDIGLDRSARAAVFKASPLPVPFDSAEFEPFRQFILKVKPENIV